MNAIAELTDLADRSLLIVEDDKPFLERLSILVVILPVVDHDGSLTANHSLASVGVGVETDSPKEHGMDTIIIQDGRDLPGLIGGLRERLSV